jgi:hypothetical protein
VGEVTSFDEWARFRIRPQRQLEKALDGLETQLTDEQKWLLSVIGRRYHELMRISESLALDLVAASERLAGRR